MTISPVCFLLSFPCPFLFPDIFLTLSRLGFSDPIYNRFANKSQVDFQLCCHFVAIPHVPRPPNNHQIVSLCPQTLSSDSSTPPHIYVRVSVSRGRHRGFPPPAQVSEQQFIKFFSERSHRRLPQDCPPGHSGLRGLLILGIRGNEPPCLCWRPTLGDQ